LPIANFISKIVGVGCKNKKIPEEILNSPLVIQKSFLEGLLDGDGKNPHKITNTSKQRTLKVSSKALTYQTRIILSNLGYWSNVYQFNDGSSISYIVPISKESVSYKRNLVIKNYILKPISSIEIKKEKIEVFNFEVEDDNSYVSDFIVHNCELYVNELQIGYDNKEELSKYAKDLNPEETDKFRASPHLLAIAINNTGYKNLVKLTSWGWTKGFYRKPRVNYEQLLAHKEGILFTSCCYNSEVGRAFDKGGEEAGYATIEKYISMFGKENYYLEIMLLDFKKQFEYNKFIIKAHEKYKLPIILTQDVHYCNKEDSYYQRLMLMIQTKRTLKMIKEEKEKDAMKDFFELQDENLWMKSEEELNEKWLKDYSEIIPYEIFCEAKKNTVKVCERAKGVEFDRSLKLPIIDSCDERLKEAIKSGFVARGLPKNNTYLGRIKEEYSLITRKGFSSYFLIQKMMTDEARRICPLILGSGDGSEAVGPGRGSAVGSLVCYCLGITDVDPIKEDLLFSRFLSESRGGRSMMLEFKDE
jgi:DNA polymerase-3 subunit alpha